MTVPVTVPSPLRQIASALERTLWTYIEAVIGAFIVRSASTNIFDVSNTRIAAIAAIPAALTFLIAALPTLVIHDFALDLFYRVTRTFVVAFAGFLIAIVPFQLSLSALAAAGTAGLVAAIAVVKGAIASRIGARNTAATLPARLDEAA